MDIDKYFKILKQIPLLFSHNNQVWCDAKTKAIYQNHWLTDDFINLKTQLIEDTFFANKNLQTLKNEFLQYELHKKKKIALLIEDNIILSGIYNLIISFGLGREIQIKSLPHHHTLLQPIVNILNTIEERIFFVDKIYDCAEYVLFKKEKLSPTAISYFQKYPYIAHTPQKGIAVIEGNESNEKLQLLAKHIFSFWGMENLNVGKILVPHAYDMNLLFENFKTYFYLKQHAHYGLQYDYHLATIILQKKKYFTNGLITLFESPDIFSPVSTLSFEYYPQIPNLASLENSDTSYILKANDLQENTFQEIESKNSKKAINLLHSKTL